MRSAHTSAQLCFSGSSNLNGKRKTYLIAFYLPQYHPIPENDLWWGRGFTEWTNVARARSLFPGHCQPNIPADLGFYDLRLPEARSAQAEMALEYGISAFCYWHYWFAGKRLLERPFNEVLSTGEPKIPFCLGWANDSWSGVWHGCPEKILIEQTYPGKADNERHFKSLLKAFTDERYFKIREKPLFIIYKPYRLPNALSFIEHWQDMAVKEGIKGIHFVAHVNSMDWDASAHGFDAVVPHNPGITTWFHFNPPQGSGGISKLAIKRKPDLMEYKEYIKLALPQSKNGVPSYPCVVPSWDNTPRCGNDGMVLTNSTPELFKKHLSEAISAVSAQQESNRIIFIKSWNEWAEGNYLEPDLKHGRGYLDACREALSA
jgi:lipopolysaccharide biosynthesis protein